MDQARHTLSVAVKYLDTTTIKENSKFYKNTLPHDMIFTKEDTSTNDEQVEVMSKEHITRYKVCVESFIYILYKIVYLYLY